MHLYASPHTGVDVQAPSCCDGSWPFAVQLWPSRDISKLLSYQLGSHHFHSSYKFLPHDFKDHNIKSGICVLFLDSQLAKKTQNIKSSVFYAYTFLSYRAQGMQTLLNLRFPALFVLSNLIGLHRQIQISSEWNWVLFWDNVFILYDDSIQWRRVHYYS